MTIGSAAEDEMTMRITSAQSTDVSVEGPKRAVAIDVAFPLKIQPSIHRLQTSPPDRPVAKVFAAIKKLHLPLSSKAVSWTKTIPLFQGGWWRTAEGSTGGFFS